MRLIILACLAAAMPASAHAASYGFTWEGSNGYRIEGAFSISDRLAKKDYVSEKDVECFRIIGFQTNETIGSWRLGQLTDETSWRFNFEPSTLRIRTGGRNYYGNHSQEWNMNGRGNDCGVNGFGFNSGTYAQDICLDNRLIIPSQVDPDKPLKAQRDDDIKFKGSDCDIMLMS